MAPVILGPNGQPTSAPLNLPKSVQAIIGASGRFDRALLDRSIEWQWAHFEVNRSRLSEMVLSHASGDEDASTTQDIREMAAAVGGQLLLMMVNLTGLRNGEALLSVLHNQKIVKDYGGRPFQSNLEWNLRFAGDVGELGGAFTAMHDDPNLRQEDLSRSEDFIKGPLAHIFSGAIAYVLDFIESLPEENA